MSKRFLSYGAQSIDESDIRAVVKTLRSPYLTQGPEVRRFEEMFAATVGAKYAVAVSSGTAGLHLACIAAGFAPGKEVITSPLSFVATSNAILYAGATPRFADVDDRSLSLSSREARKKISVNTAGIIPVHFAGQPVSCHFKMKGIVIEDACHALGAEINDGGWKKIGSCHKSDMAVFSFHPVKHITTGEGGMVTTGRKDLYEKLLSLRSHGIEKDPRRFLNKKESGNPWFYEMRMLGFNYRMTDIQCALGSSQLKKLKHFVAKRCEIAERYDREFASVEWLRTPTRMAGTRPSFHLYILRFDFKKIQTTRAQVMRYLHGKGIGTQVHYIPIPQQPYYRERFGHREGDFPVAEKYYSEALSIPMHPGLTVAEVKYVAKTILLLKKWTQK